jgi:hypothetical protein
MTSTTRKGFLAEPGRIDLSYGANFEHFVLTMDPDALSKTLAGLVGMPISAPLKLDMSDYEARPETPGARSLVGLLAADLENELSTLSPLLNLSRRYWWRFCAATATITAGSSKANLLMQAP